jgi:hypothetical protein
MLGMLGITTRQQRSQPRPRLVQHDDEHSPLGMAVQHGSGRLLLSQSASTHCQRKPRHPGRQGASRACRELGGHLMRW